MMPATAMRSSRMTRTTAVAGLNAPTMADHDRTMKKMRPPRGGGLICTMESAVPWGGLGGYPFTPWTNVPLV